MHWTHEQSIETHATAERIWSLLSDVAGWKNWNAGIERIEIHGAFANGTTFLMQPPGSEPFTSTLLDVRENAGFTDETIIEGTRVLVHHRIVAATGGRNRIVYATEIDGPAAAEIGPLVTADFGDVLQALKEIAESPRQAFGPR